MPQDEKELTTPIELPCGLLRDGAVVREAEITPMTGRVRKNIARPDVRKNGARIIDAVLLACVRTIGGKRVDRQVLDELFVGDRDFLTMKIRQLSLGDRVSAHLQCGSCRERIDFDIDLGEVELYPLADGACEIAEDGRTRLFRIENPALGVRAAFRYPAGKDQHAIVPLAQKNPVEANYRMYLLCLEEWNGQPKPFPNTFFENLPLNVLDWVDGEFTARMPGPELEHEVICDLCGTANPMSLEMSNFLFPQPGEARRRKHSG
jgi:hypothetical protein